MRVCAWLRMDCSYRALIVRTGTEDQYSILVLRSLKE